MDGIIDAAAEIGFNITDVNGLNQEGMIEYLSIPFLCITLIRVQKFINTSWGCEFE